MATVSKTFSVRNGIDVANTIVLDSNRNLSNVIGANVVTANATTVNAINIFTSAGLDVTGQANAAREQANTARMTANDAYVQANTARDQANAAYSDANTRVLRAGDTMTGNLTVNAHINTNTTFVNKKTTLQAPSTINFDGERLRLYDFLQLGHPNYAIGVEPNNIWVGTDENNGGTGFKWYGNTTQAAVMLSNGTLRLSNTVEAKILRANGTGTAIDASQGDILTNKVTGTKFSFLAGANTVNVDASGATANYTFTLPANSGLVGQVLVTNGNGLTAFSSDVYLLANISYGQANTARNTANDAYSQANSARNQANTARDTANDAYGQANTARTTANNAYAEANLKLNIAGGTINGSLNVSGNLSVTGNTSYINVSTFVVDDPLFYLAANNDTSDIVDIGFVGAKNSGPAVTHTGLARNAGDGTWYLFDNLADSGHQNNVIDFANTTLATLRANINANSILLTGNPVATQANLTLAHDQANAARGQANTAYGQANAARDQANTARDTANGAYSQANGAYGQANGAYTQANGAYTQANGAYSQANGAYSQANGAYTQANVAANTVRVYANSGSVLSNKFLNFVNTASIQVSVADSTDGNANISFVTTGAAVADAYAQANAAYGQANAAYADANTRVLKTGDIMTGTLNITTTGEGFKVANANVTNHLTVGTLNVRTNTVTTSTTGQVVLDTFALTAHASAKYFIQANSGINYTVTEIILVHDGINIYLTEYGTIQSGSSLGVFSADIDAGNARLLFTANNNVNTIRSVRYGVLVP